MITFEELQASLHTGDAPPAGMPGALVALWHDARGDWHAAHETVQSESGDDAAWVHAYLHRKEGDSANARYWYQRASRPPADEPLDVEWAAIATELLGRKT